MAKDLKETPAAGGPQDPRVLRGSPGSLGLRGKGGQLAQGVSQASKGQRAASELGAQEDNRAPKGM